MPLKKLPANVCGRCGTVKKLPLPAKMATIWIAKRTPPMHWAGLKTAAFPANAMG